ncbi:hypothetical protein RHCRD62_10288 [Rhodococcus sp. RD6.2]|nr:hypothetical protein RHCRD62_10288 [Rhodococcus sp. RD6.2]
MQVEPTVTRELAARESVDPVDEGLTG